MGYHKHTLAALLTTVFDEHMHETVREPWTTLADELATALVDGELTLERASRIDHLLRRTKAEELSKCETCTCPMPGMFHG